jgi:predicted RNase H-like HicB family nuclease
MHISVDTHIFDVFKGDTQYVAEGVHVPVVTQASTLEKLIQNIRNALSLHFEEVT